VAGLKGELGRPGILLAFGLLLILAFSAGMAAVLAGVSLVLVYAGRAVERVGLQHRWIGGLTNRVP